MTTTLAMVHGDPSHALQAHALAAVAEGVHAEWLAGLGQANGHQGDGGMKHTDFQAIRKYAAEVIPVVGDDALVHVMHDMDVIG